MFEDQTTLPAKRIVFNDEILEVYSHYGGNIHIQTYCPTRGKSEITIGVNMIRELGVFIREIYGD